MAAVTPRARLTALLADAGITDVDPARADEHELAAKTVFVGLVDRVASRTTDPAEFQRWAAGLTPDIGLLTVAGHREFLHRRISDWTLYLGIRSGHPPTPAELAEASDWMQRVIAAESTSPPVLAVLAETGRTRKIRAVAANRARSRAVTSPRATPD